jgi:nucleoside-diphosphate-sugar epimerase
LTAGMRALVTGSSGFIGQHCVRYLAQRGWQVRAVDIHEPHHAQAAMPGVEYRQLDLRDAAGVASALTDIEVVFNLASVHLDVGASYADFESVNVKALEKLVELCAVARVRRLVHVSSVGVYGHVSEPPAREDAPLKPVNDYERTKRAGEDIARKAAQQHHVDLVIVRPSWVYGPGCPRTEKLVHALQRGRFFYIGPAKNLRHPVYIQDFLDGLSLAALAGPEVSGKTFNLAGPRWMTVGEMVETFAQAIKARPPSLRIPRWLGFTAGWAAEQVGAITRINPPISRRTLAFFENDNAFDIGAARQFLKYEPRTELIEGVRQTMQL